jgi:hypothetical protein
MTITTVHTYTTMNHSTNPPVEHQTEENARAYAVELTTRAQGETTVKQGHTTIAKYSGGMEEER